MPFSIINNFILQPIQDSFSSISRNFSRDNLNSRLDFALGDQFDEAPKNEVELASRLQMSLTTLSENEHRSSITTMADLLRTDAEIKARIDNNNLDPLLVANELEKLLPNP